MLFYVLPFHPTPQIIQTTNFTERNSSLEPNNLSLDQEIPRLVWNHSSHTTSLFHELDESTPRRHVLFLHRIKTFH
jgi:hypothetical protein